MAIFKKKEKTIPEQQSSATTVKAQINEKAQIVSVEPRTYEEIQFVADHLKGRRAVVVNLHRLPEDKIRRVKDFLSGVIYVIDGSVEKLSESMFLFTPSAMGVAKQEHDEIVASATS